MNLFELFVKVGVDDQASGKLDTLSQKIGNGLKKAAKIGTAAVAMATTAIVGLTTASIKSYAEYEQLVGGVETLFKSSSKKVQQYASEAYKTAGLSANEYMNTVTSFSASLLQGLKGDTEAAAKYADMAVRDMSDNANKMGTSMELIQNAYQGFAKQNYTMLDNLKLGYGGTKSEMERLVKDAAKIDESINANSLSFENIVAAINVMQTEMGIAGTTAQEAASTISGSIGMMQSAWSNLITGIANDNADFDTLISQFVDSVGTVGENILPRIDVALNGVVKLISELFPKIAAELPGLIKTLLPSLLSGIVDVIGAIVENLPEIIDSILSILPDLIDQLVEALVELTPKLTEAIVEIVQSIADNLPEIIQAILDAIPVITESVNQAILDNFPALLNAIIQIVLTIVQNLPTIIQTLVDQIGPIVSTIVQVIIENAPAFIAGIVQIVVEIVKALPSILASIGESVMEIFKGIGKGLVDAWPKFKEGIKELWDNVAGWFGDKWEEVKSWGKDIVDGIKEGIKEKWEALTSWFTKKWDALVGGVKDFLGIHSPSRVFAGIGQNMALGVEEGFNDEFAHIKDDMEDALNFEDASVGINASIRRVGAGAAGGAYGQSSAMGSQNVNVTVTIDDGVSAMGLARALLPYLKIAEKEVYA